MPKECEPENKHPGAIPSADGECHIDKLPDEILLRILTYVGCTIYRGDPVYYDVDPQQGTLLRSPDNEKTHLCCQGLENISSIKNVSLRWKNVAQRVIRRGLFCIDTNFEETHSLKLHRRAQEACTHESGVCSQCYRQFHTPENIQKLVAEIVRPLPRELPFRRVHISDFHTTNTVTCPTFKGVRSLSIGGVHEIHSGQNQVIDILFSKVGCFTSSDLLKCDLRKIPFVANLERWTEFFSTQNITSLELGSCYLHEPKEHSSAHIYNHRRQGPPQEINQFKRSALEFGQAIKGLPLEKLEIVEYGKSSYEKNSTFSTELLFHMGCFLPKTLESLHINAPGIPLTDGLLSDPSNLKHIYLEEIFLSEEGFSQMLSALQKQEKLESLSLIALRIMERQDKFVLSLPDILDHLPPQLEKLTLDNRVTMERDFAFPSQLKELKFLNAIATNDMLQKLAKHLPGGLAHLDISIRDNIPLNLETTPAHVLSFLQQARMPEIKFLDISHRDLVPQQMSKSFNYISNNEMKFPKLKEFSVSKCQQPKKLKSPKNARWTYEGYTIIFS